MPAQPPLAVTCVTCGSRLKVLDPRLIGSIANCPKCGAMVDLPAPPIASPHRERPQLAVGPDTGIDSEALTQSTVASPQELADSATLAGGAGFEPGASEMEAPPLPADPAQVWQSESSRRVSQFGLVVTLGLFGLIAATVAFVQFARSWNSSVPPPLAVADTDAVANDAPGPTVDAQTPANGAAPSAEPSGTTETEPADAATAEPAEIVEQADGEDADTLAADAAAAVRTDGTGAVDPPTAASPAPDAQPPVVADPPVVLTPDAPAPTGFDELPPGLRKFVPLTNLSTAEIGPPQLFDAPPTIDSIQLDAAAGEQIEEEPTVKRPSVDVSRALAMRFAIDHGGATLSELMLLVSQLTGVAVEVELISLDLAGVSTTATLETPAGWMSVQQWLDRSLAPLGLAAEVIDQRVLIYATPQKLAQVGGAALRLDDFGDSAAQIAQWIQPVAGSVAPSTDAEQATDEANAQAEEPGDQPAADGAGEQAEDQDDPQAAELWEYVAAEKRLAVPLDRAALVRAVLAVEAARRIHGLPGRLPRWQTVRWMGVWTPQHAADADQPQRPSDAISDWPMVTDGAGGPTLDSPRTTAGLLRQLAADNQVAIIVAWADALRHQFYPADLAMPYTDHLSAGAVLDEIVGEAGLQARDAGGSVWWIGSEANYDRYEVIAWMSIPAGSGEATAQRLAQALGVTDPAGLPVVWNETTLLVRAPRYIARQLTRFVHPK